MDISNPEQENTQTAAERVAKIRAEKKQDKKQSFWTKRIDRREAVGLGLTLVAGAAIGGLGRTVTYEPSSDAPKQTNKALIPTPKAEKLIEESSDEELLNKKILANKPGSAERGRAEKTYLDRIISDDNLIRISRALLTFSNQEYRKELLDKLYALRQQGKFVNHKPLPIILEEWAEKRKSHPETAATCWEMYSRAKDITQSLLNEYINDPVTEANIQQDVKEIVKGLEGLKISTKDLQILNSHALYRPDLAHLVKVGKLPWGVLLNLKAEDVMLNVGGMTELVCRESGIAYQRVVGKDEHENNLYDLVSYGFVNPGYVAAYDHINKEKFPTGVEDMRKIAGIMKEITSFDFQAETFPGSVASSDDQSGGAIGTPQFMPSKIIELLNFLSVTEKRKVAVGDLRRNLIPFDKNGAVILAWIMLSRGYHIGKGEDDVENYRYGFLRGSNAIKLPNGNTLDMSDTIRWNAVDSWNRNTEEIKAIIEADQSFANLER